MIKYYISKAIGGPEVSLVKYVSDYEFNNYTEFDYRSKNLEVNQFTESLDKKYPDAEYKQITKEEFEKEKAAQELRISGKREVKFITDQYIMKSPEYNEIPCPSDEQLSKLMVVLRQTTYIYNNNDSVTIKQIKEKWNDGKIEELKKNIFNLKKELTKLRKELNKLIYGNN